MKIIKIFLASSIEDLKLDRIEVGDFFRQLDDIYIERGIHFKLIKCESYDKSIQSAGMQEKLDDEIRGSELVFFLFFKKVGDYTRHEFEVAVESFRKTEKPKIVTYFKYVNSEKEVNEDVKAFMGMLDSEMKHYYHTYGNIDTLKLGMLMQIKLMKLDDAVVDIRDGQICVNGNVIADSRQIPIFAGNEAMNKLRKRLEELTGEYYALRERFNENMDDMELYEKYSRTAKEKAETEKAIREMEKQMLNMAEKMTADVSSGKLSARQREGYRLIEKGDYDGALEVLDYNEIMGEIKHNKTIAEGIGERLQTNVNELLQRIEVLKSKGVTKESAKEIRKIYDEACGIAERYNLSKNVMHKYASFLHKQKDYNKAIETAEQLKYYYANPKESVSDHDKAVLYNLLGILYNETHRLSEAEEMYKKALEIYGRLSKDNLEGYDGYLADSYNNLGNLYSDTQRLVEAEEMYKKALEIYGRLSKDNPDGYEADLAISYNNLGLLYSNTQRLSEAEKLYKKAAEIYEGLSKDDPDAYKADLANSYNNLGLLYSNTQRLSKAERLYKKVIEMRETLSRINPDGYEADLACSYNNIGVLYSDTQRLVEAEDMYKKAIEIRKRLSKINPDAYEGYLAMSYDNLGNLYSDTQRLGEAEEQHKKGIEIIERISKRKPEAYEEDLASSYNNMGALYYHAQRFSEAEDMYKKAVEIRKRLSKRAPDAYDGDLAGSYNNLGILYSDTHRFSEAEDMYKKAVEIRERLSKINPDAHEGDLAGSYNNIGLLCSNAQRFSEAEEMHKKAIDIRERLSRRNPEAYEEDLAKSYNNLGLLYSDTQRLSKAEELYKKAIEIFERLDAKNPGVYSSALEIVRRNLRTVQGE